MYIVFSLLFQNNVVDKSSIVMIGNTSEGILIKVNMNDSIPLREDAEDDKVFGMRQFRENNAENLTDDEYLETVIFYTKHYCAYINDIFYSL